MSTPIEGVEIEWSCPDHDWDEFRIYKSEEPFDSESLPEIYDTVAPQFRRYLDTNVSSTEAYYLAVPVLSGVEYPFGDAVKRSVFSEVVPIGAALLGGWYIGNVTVTDEPTPMYTQDRRGTYAVIAREGVPTSAMGAVFQGPPGAFLLQETSETDAVRNTRLWERIHFGLGVPFKYSPFLRTMHEEFSEWEGLASIEMLNMLYQNRGVLPETLVNISYHVSSTANSVTALKARRTDSAGTTTQNYTTINTSYPCILVKMIRLPDA